jgi:hypothetical protein
LQPESVLPQSLLVCEGVSLWAILPATRLLQAKQLSQPVNLSLEPFHVVDVFLRVKAIQRAIRSAQLLLELARRNCWQNRLLERAQET